MVGPIVAAAFLWVLLSTGFGFAWAQETTVAPKPPATNADNRRQPAPRLPLSELERRAKSGDPAAQDELGLRYLRGVDVDKDPAQAMQWFRKAALVGYAGSCFNIGIAFYNGVGASINDEEACKWFLLASDAGFAEATESLDRCGRELSASRITNSQVLAGDAYLSGNEVRQNLNRALQLYQNAFAGGSGRRRIGLA